MSDETKIKMEVCETWNNLKDKTKMIDYLIDSKMQIAKLKQQLKSQPAEIVEKIRKDFLYGIDGDTFGIDIILDTILKEYQK